MATQKITKTRIEKLQPTGKEEVLWDTEALTLKWDYIDFGRQTLELPDTKSGYRSITIGEAAIEFLGTIPRIKGHEYVFPGRLKGKPYQNVSKPWEAIRKRSGLEDVRMHDLRHAYVTVAVSEGTSLEKAGQMVGHKDVSSTRRYTHRVNEGLIGPANRTAGVWKTRGYSIIAFTSGDLIAWLERKLEENSVAKIIPDDDTVANAYRRMRRQALVQKRIDETLEDMGDDNEDPVPTDLRTLIAEAQKADRKQIWDEALCRIAMRDHRRTSPCRRSIPTWFL